MDDLGGKPTIFGNIHMFRNIRNTPKLKYHILNLVNLKGREKKPENFHIDPSGVWTMAKAASFAEPQIKDSRTKHSMYDIFPYKEVNVDKIHRPYIECLCYSTFGLAKKENIEEPSQLLLIPKLWHQSNLLKWMLFIAKTQQLPNFTSQTPSILGNHLQLGPSENGENGISIIIPDEAPCQQNLNGEEREQVRHRKKYLDVPGGS